MATKFKTPEAPEGFTDTTKAEPIPVFMDESPAPTPDPEPARASAVLVGHRTLSDDEVRRVNQTKQHFDAAIAYLTVLRDSYHDAEVQRMFAVAVTNAETASMWAVRAITHRG